MLDRLERSKPASVAVHFRSLPQFFKWAVDEGEMETSPMARLKPRVVPEEPPTLLSDSDIRQLLKTCERRTLSDRRDTAIIRLLLDTGMRRSELAGLKVSDVRPLRR